MDIAAQLEIHAKQELDHALTISRQVDYLGKMPAVSAKPVRTSNDPKDMLLGEPVPDPSGVRQESPRRAVGTIEPFERFPCAL